MGTIRQKLCNIPRSLHNKRSQWISVIVRFQPVQDRIERSARHTFTYIAFFLFTEDRY